MKSFLRKARGGSTSIGTTDETLSVMKQQQQIRCQHCGGTSRPSPQAAQELTDEEDHVTTTSELQQTSSSTTNVVSSTLDNDGCTTTTTTTDICQCSSSSSYRRNSSNCTVIDAATSSSTTTSSIVKKKMSHFAMKLTKLDTTTTTVEHPEKSSDHSCHKQKNRKHAGSPPTTSRTASTANDSTFLSSDDDDDSSSSTASSTRTTEELGEEEEFDHEDDHDSPLSSEMPLLDISAEGVTVTPPTPKKSSTERDVRSPRASAAAMTPSCHYFRTTTNTDVTSDSTSLSVGDEDGIEAIPFHNTTSNIIVDDDNDNNDVDVHDEEDDNNNVDDTDSADGGDNVKASAISIATGNVIAKSQPSTTCDEKEYNIPDFITQTDQYGNSIRPSPPVVPTVTGSTMKQPSSNKPSSKKKEETFIDSLRVMCCCLLLDDGSKKVIDDGTSSKGASHVTTVSSSTTTTKMTETERSFTTVTEDEDAYPYHLPPPTSAHPPKKCLVLDLDETLVHSSFRPVPSADFVLPVQVDQTLHSVYVAKRPGVDEFLKDMANYFEIVVYTASLNKYADPLLDLLDPSNTYITHRLFREHCAYYEGHYVKDLNLLNRPLESTIIVDNSPNSYLFHPENAIDCSSFIDNPNDVELQQIGNFLKGIVNIQDVRHVCRSWRGWPDIDLDGILMISSSSTEEENNGISNADDDNDDDKTHNLNNEDEPLVRAPPQSSSLTLLAPSVSSEEADFYDDAQPSKQYPSSSHAVGAAVVTPANGQQVGILKAFS